MIKPAYDNGKTYIIFSEIIFAHCKARLFHLKL